MKRFISMTCFAAALVFATSSFAATDSLPSPTAKKEVAADLQEARLQNVDQVMLHLNAAEKNTAMIPSVYSADVFFVDPLFPEGLRGHEPLLRYHTALNAMIESFVVDVEEVTQDGDTILVFWKATATLNVKINLGQSLKKAGLPTLGHKLEFNALKIGPVSYDGMTRFGFAEGSSLINFHKDYYDSLSQYESIPVLKQILGAVKDQNRKGLMLPVQAD